MGKADKYTISLKSLSEGTHSYEYTLDHTFFSEIDSPEIQNGDVNIGLMLRRTGDTFELHFDIKGHIVIPCDRCLDDMELPVETEDTLYVKFGEEYSEEGENLIVVPEAEGTINLAWYMYECIALTIPLKHTHPEGMCNPEMETLLKAHSAASDEISGDEEPVDPRWNALKKLKEIDPSKEEFIQKIAIKTEKFTSIKKAACEQLILTVNEMIENYGVGKE